MTSIESKEVQKINSRDRIKKPKKKKSRSKGRKLPPTLDKERKSVDIDVKGNRIRTIVSSDDDPAYRSTHTFGP